MRIMLIDVNYKYSSTGKIVYDLHSSFTKLGHSSYVSYGRGKSTTDHNVLKHSNQISVYFHVLITRILGYVGYGNFINTEILIRKIKKIKPDIVHLHTLHGYHLNIYRLLNYLSESKTKTVLTLHDTVMFTGKCGHTYDCEKWETECFACPLIKEYPKSIFFDHTRHEFRKKKLLIESFNTLYVSSVSKWLADKAMKSKIMKKYDIKAIYNGIDTKVFFPRIFKNNDFKSPENPLRLLFVTPRFEDTAKGGKHLIDLANRLLDIDVLFDVVGPVEFKYQNTNIHFIGKIANQEELALQYSQADCLLMLSKLETFSMVTVESLACGTPVIGFDALGPKEIAPNEFGIFVENGNIDELEKVIRNIFYGQIKFADSQVCFNYINTKFSSDVMSYKYIDLYNTISQNIGDEYGK